MYRFSAFLLLLGLLAPLFFYSMLEINRAMIKHEMEEKLERQEMQVIRLSAKEVRWYKADKEIIIHGELFDVKSMEIIGDSVEFSGLFDDEETAIKLKTEAFAQQQHSPKEQKRLHRLFSMNWYFHHSVLDLSLLVSDIPINYNSLQSSILKLFIPYPSQPPETFTFS